MLPVILCVMFANIYSHQLPDDVFVEGETRPTKPIKEKRKKKATGARTTGSKTTSAKVSAEENGATATTKMKRQFDGTGIEVRIAQKLKCPLATSIVLGAQACSRTDSC